MEQSNQAQVERVDGEAEAAVPPAAETSAAAASDGDLALGDGTVDQALLNFSGLWSRTVFKVKAMVGGVEGAAAALLSAAHSAVKHCATVDDAERLKAQLQLPTLEENEPASVFFGSRPGVKELYAFDVVAAFKQLNAASAIAVLASLDSLPDNVPDEVVDRLLRLFNRQRQTAGNKRRLFTPIENGVKKPKVHQKAAGDESTDEETRPNPPSAASSAAPKMSPLASPSPFTKPKSKRSQVVEFVLSGHSGSESDSEAEDTSKASKAAASKAADKRCGPVNNNKLTSANYIRFNSLVLPFMVVSLSTVIYNCVTETPHQIKFDLLLRIKFRNNYINGITDFASDSFWDAVGEVVWFASNLLLEIFQHLVERKVPEHIESIFPDFQTARRTCRMLKGVKESNAALVKQGLVQGTPGHIDIVQVYTSAARVNMKSALTQDLKWLRSIPVDSIDVKGTFNAEVRQIAETVGLIKAGEKETVKSDAKFYLSALGHFFRTVNNDHASSKKNKKH